MSPAQILALIRDFAILAALGFAIYLLINYGENRVTSQDFKAVQRQLDANAQQQTKWNKERTDAEHQRDVDLADIRGRIGAQSAPIIVRVPTGTGTVPGASAPAGSAHPASGPTGEGSGSVACDVRGAVNAFELKYEAALADCRSVLAEWPR